MKQLILLALLLLSAMLSNAQERKVTTVPFEDGTLTFHYYEKDGIKVPDGLMEFTKKNYTEKGENKDGYREGKWIATIKNKTNSTVTEYNYKRGLLEGQTTIKFTTTDKSLLKSRQPRETYNFHNGRLVGENKIVQSSDTIYCNFGSNGERIGTWKIINPRSTRVIEYDQESNCVSAYELDVLGQKTPVMEDGVYMSIVVDLQMFGKKFSEVFFSFYDNNRPKLPTLCANKYGYISPFEKEQSYAW